MALRYPATRAPRAVRRRARAPPRNLRRRPDAAVGDAAAARATSSTASCPRQPVRPPGTPTSTQTSTGRRAPAAVNARGHQLDPAYRIDPADRLEIGDAHPIRPQANAIRPRRPTRWPGSPSARRTRGRRAAWLIVATVTPHAPASSWRASSCGAMCVLPCGASSTPRSRHHVAIVATLCVRAESSSTHSGPTAPSDSGRGPAAHTSAGVRPHHDDGMPLYRQSSGSSVSAVTRDASRPMGMAFI